MTTNPIEKGEEITDSITRHIDRRFINSTDLIGKGDCAVEISRVEKLPQIVYENKQTKKNPILLYFTHTEKPLVLNNTHIRQITVALKTSDVSSWKGKKVAIFAEEGMFFGKQQYAVRFREKAPQ